MVGFVRAEGEALELFEFAEVIFDQVTPLVHFLINIEGLSPLRPLRNHDLCAACVQVIDNPVTVIGLVGEQGPELDA